jgi:hypothetical protein
VKLLASRASPSGHCQSQDVATFVKGFGRAALVGGIIPLEVLGLSAQSLNLGTG